MIEVYVAGASRNWQRARAFMNRVRAHEHMRITSDWTVDVERATVPDRDLTAEERTVFATADLAGVATADVLVVLLDASVVSVGRWVELGYALRMRDEATDPRACHVCHAPPVRVVPALRIIVSGGQRLSIFTAPGMVDFEHTYAPGTHDDDAFAALAHYAKALS